MILRIQKYLANANVASRRKAEELIVAGEIFINGEPAKLGAKIDTQKDIVCYNLKQIKMDTPNIYILLHKPRGYVTTVKDQFMRACVLDLIKDVTDRIYPVGRLDFDTSGALLLTNDGSLAFTLTHPKHNIDKTYLVRMMGEPNKEELNQFSRGLIIDGYKTAPAKIEILKTEGKICYAKVTIHEGKNHQIKKMCKAINHPVATIKRLAIGEITLNDLSLGKYRHLTKKEIDYLKKL